MSLATRCTACGTVFRVVQDQLRVSEGWVRCGRCTEVFNAVENLVDPPLTAGPAPATSGQAMARVGSGLAQPPMAPPTSGGQRNEPRNEPHNEGHRDGPGTGLDFDLPLGQPGDDRPAWARSDLPDGTPDADDHEGASTRPEASAGPTVRADGGSDFSTDPDDRYGASSLLPSGFEPSVQPDDDALRPVLASNTPTAATAADLAGEAGSPAARDTGQPLPSFVRRADRAARWQQPRVRAALSALVVLGVAGLFAQVAHSYRDLLAARWPATQPLLAQGCALLGCTLQAPRLIDALVVDSSGLLRVERSAVYRLSVTLRNQDRLAVAVPALDLSLTDTQGRQIARRVLLATELGHTPARLEAGAELPLQATLQVSEGTGQQAVAGYTIDIFYP